MPPSQLEKENFGGDLDFQYQHEVFWPAMYKLCKERRDARFTRWQKYGNGKAGVSEYLLKGGEEQSSANHVSFDDHSTPLRSRELSAAMSLSPSTDTSSPARSVHSVGYQLPPEAAGAPDWNEPDSPRASSEISDSHSSHDATHLAAPATQDRRGSSTSFASASAAPKHIVEKARDDDALEASVGTLQSPQSAFAEPKDGAVANIPASSTLPNGDLEAGIAGLVIKPDGSVAGS